MPDLSPDLQELYERASDAARQAYAPYSGFSVGAAIRTEDGSIFTGCNVENASYGLTLCAERVAAGSALAAGHRVFDAVAISVSGAHGAPCGACRQFLAEFGPSMTVVFPSAAKMQHTTLDQLLPAQFSRQDLPSQ